MLRHGIDLRKISKCMIEGRRCVEQKNGNGLYDHDKRSQHIARFQRGIEEHQCCAIVSSYTQRGRMRWGDIFIHILLAQRLQRFSLMVVLKKKKRN